MQASPSERGAAATAAPRITETGNTSFDSHRKAARALLNSGATLTRKAGSFVGQLAVDPTPLTPAKGDWLAKLLERAGLTSLDTGRAR